jgi:hypothetical protein
VSEPVIIATIAAIPPTLAAIAALYQVRKLSRPLGEVNAAVNHRAPGQRRLVELVDDIHTEIHNVADEVREVRDQLNRHQAWHQTVIEEWSDTEDDKEEDTDEDTI